MVMRKRLDYIWALVVIYLLTMSVGCADPERPDTDEAGAGGAQAGTADHDIINVDTNAGRDVGTAGSATDREPDADAATFAAGRGGTGIGGAGRGGSKATSGQSVPVIPVKRGGTYVFEFDELTFEIDPQIGGRIRTFALNGQNVLTGPEVDPDNWGSTFWPSPQQRWNWPPIPELDSQPYRASVSDDTLVLKSEPGTRAKVSVEKRVRAIRERAAIDIEYTLTNTDTVAASWAPWEISRVAPSGLTFFPSGSGTVTANLPVQNIDKVTYYQHDPKAFNGSGQKYTADGNGGWLVQVSENLLFLKTFTDVAPAMQAPPPEAEIEIYASANYVEIEPQGPYTLLQPNQAVRWTVRWYLRRLPETVAAEPGNAELLRFVHSITTL